MNELYVPPSEEELSEMSRGLAKEILRKSAPWIKNAGGETWREKVARAARRILRDLAYGATSGVLVYFILRTVNLAKPAKGRTLDLQRVPDEAKKPLGKIPRELQERLWERETYRLLSALRNGYRGYLEREVRQDEDIQELANLNRERTGHDLNDPWYTSLLDLAYERWLKGAK